MKKNLFVLVLMLSKLLFGQENIKVIQIFDIKDEIDPRMTRQVKLGFDEADKNNADLVIIDMNTFGGRVDDADKIRSMVLNYKKPVFVFINNNAASAGALISIACDSIYMTQGANIGAATVVNGTDGQAMPDKYQSYMRSMMRSTAEANKRDPKIAEAMVDPSIEIPGIIAADKVLTFTTSEAIKNGYCEGEYLTIDQLIEKKGLKNAIIKRHEQSSTEKIIAFFLNPAISSILILAIIGGIYFELQTPGIGFALLVAIVAGVLYLVPYYLNGLAQNWEIIMLFLGIALLAVEIFVIPGFGVAGILGAIMVALSLGLVMLNNDWFDFTFVPQESIMAASLASLVGVGGFVVAFFVFGGQILKSKRMKRIALMETMETAVETSQGLNLSAYVGQIGETTTPLRPSGKVKVDSKTFNAYSQGDFIEKGEKVKIIGAFGGNLSVERSTDV